MATVYTEIPHNFTAISSFVITDKKNIAAKIYERKACYFYDTCSFRNHAHLSRNEAEHLFEYFKRRDGAVIITRCVLMELASHSGWLNPEYIQYIREISRFGIDILLIYEEDIFDVMSACFATNAIINGYLTWAARMVKHPTSTITAALEQNDSLQDDVIKGRNADSSDIYRRFFASVRGSKESGDNLGEELIAVCLHILSKLPGEGDGKFCVITDDKGAAGRIDTLFKKTDGQFRGKKIVIFSTPKLAQILYNEAIITDKVQIKAILSACGHRNIVVLGTQIYDLRSVEISLSCAELAELIVKPNGINITF